MGAPVREFSPKVFDRIKELLLIDVAYAEVAQILYAERLVDEKLTGQYIASLATQKRFTDTCTPNELTLIRKYAAGRRATHKGTHSGYGRIPYRKQYVVPAPREKIEVVIDHNVTGTLADIAENGCTHPTSETGHMLCGRPSLQSILRGRDTHTTTTYRPCLQRYASRKNGSRYCPSHAWLIAETVERTDIRRSLEELGIPLYLIEAPEPPPPS